MFGHWPVDEKEEICCISFNVQQFEEREENPPLVLVSSMSSRAVWKEEDGERLRELEKMTSGIKSHPVPQLCKRFNNTNTSHKLHSNSNASLLNLQSFLTLLSLHPVAVQREGVVFNYPSLCKRRVWRPWPPRLNFK